MRVWDAKSGNLVATLRHPDFVNSLAISSDGTMLITASGDRTALVWRLPPHCQSLVAAAAHELPRELSSGERDRYFLQEQPVRGLTAIYAATRPLIALVLPHMGEHCE